MSQHGIGAMLHILSGGSKEDQEKYVGRSIDKAEMRSDAFYLRFKDGTQIRISDDGQSCCERRYMTCDDDLAFLSGAMLTGISVVKTEEKSGDYGESHEIAFLEVRSDRGVATFCTHNENNGYYGGFGLNIQEVG